MKKVTAKFSSFACRKYEGNFDESVEQDENYVMMWKQ